MNSSSRGVKRPRVPEEYLGDQPFQAGPSDHHDFKAEQASPRSDATGYSHHTPGSTSRTPDVAFSVPLISQPSQYPFPTSPQQAPLHHVYPPPRSPLSHNTRAAQSSLSVAQAQPSTPDSTPHASKAQESVARNASNSAFRNVSACNRCRLRKNRCDQRLPACRACEKAGVKCVGFDPFLGREIPRSYVYYLESRTTYLENLLRDRGIQFLSAESFALEKRPDEDLSTSSEHGQNVGKISTANDGSQQIEQQQKQGSQEVRRGDTEEKKLDNLVSNIGMVYVQGASDSRYLGSTSGISFARVVFAAVKSTMSRASSDKGGPRSIKGASQAGMGAGGTASLRDSAFGLQTKPTFKQAPFPDRELGLKLVKLFFEHSNPQLPILHRGEFMNMFERVYAQPDYRKTPRESYILNIVFAIGSGIILYTTSKELQPSIGRGEEKAEGTGQSSKKAKLGNKQAQPEEYHASAIVHLETFLGSNGSSTDSGDGTTSLEELQAVLLLASFALLRPVAPGLWYIVGVAMRLAVDLGLHHEDSNDGGGPATTGTGLAAVPSNLDALKNGSSAGNVDSKDQGRRQWVRDLRRRLWWTVYSVDRLVSTCVGRPFGITDQVVTTEFPSLLDDKYITPSGFLETPEQASAPSAKLVARHYFRLRLLQSEVVQVLQHQNAQRTHAAKIPPPNEFMYTKLPSPFMRNFSSFRAWRTDIDRRLWEWKESAPTQQEAGVEFSPLFFELNYWQAVITLYQNNLAAPAALAHEVPSLDDGIGNPASPSQDESGDEEFVYLKVAEAGQKVLKLYRQIHRIHLVNYTYLATHHLFMAGISFLYAIWHSVAVRSHLSLDDVDFTVLAATSVLNDLTERCPPAEACKDAFDRLSRMCIQLCVSTTGFGPQALQHIKKTTKSASLRRPTAKRTSSVPRMPSRPTFSGDTEVLPSSSARPSPRFDMSLKELFTDEETQSQVLQRPSNAAPGYWFTQQGQQQLHGLPIAPEGQGYRPDSAEYGEGLNQQQDYSQSNPNLAIDPLLQQVSPQSQASHLSGQVPNQQQFAGYPQQTPQEQYPSMSDFDASLFDSFQMTSDDFMDGGETNMDLFGVGGADGGVDLFNGFFFGNGGGSNGLSSTEFTSN